MIGRRKLMLSTALLALSTIGGHAGPCSHEIDRIQAQVNARLEAKAAGGPVAPESSGALLHHQPPGSIATAESRLGELPPQTAEAIGQAMGRARQADRAGDLSACQQALSDVQAAIGP
jgi:predicted lipid-binding transport protein (Tim44 family)